MFEFITDHHGHMIILFLKDFFPIKESLTFWDILNAPITSAIVTAVFALLIKQSVDGVREETTSTTLAKNAEKEAEYEEAEEEAKYEEEIAISQDISLSKDYRDDTKKIVDEAKEFIDNTADTKDGRKNRTYSKIPRYNRTALAIAMEERGDLKSTQKDAAILIFTYWKQYEKGKASKKKVPKEIYDSIKTAFKNLKK